jgi:hypothetical protein
MYPSYSNIKNILLKNNSNNVEEADIDPERISEYIFNEIIVLEYPLVSHLLNIYFLFIL